MRLVGWGALWGLGLAVLPFVAFSSIGLIADPQGIGYLLFSLPVVAGAGVVCGLLGGALAAGVAPLARLGDSTALALTLCGALYFVACTFWLTIAFFLLVSPGDRLGQAPVVPIAAVVATGLAVWGFARDRQRALRARQPWIPR